MQQREQKHYKRKKKAEEQWENDKLAKAMEEGGEIFNETRSY